MDALIPNVNTIGDVAKLSAAVYVLTDISKAILGHKGRKTQAAALFVGLFVAVCNYAATTKGFEFSGLWDAFLLGIGLGAGAIGAKGIVKGGDSTEQKGLYRWEDSSGTKYEYNDPEGNGPPPGYLEAEETGRSRSFVPNTGRRAAPRRRKAELPAESTGSASESKPESTEALSTEGPEGQSRGGIGYDPKKEGF